MMKIIEIKGPSFYISTEMRHAELSIETVDIQWQINAIPTAYIVLSYHQRHEDWKKISDLAASIKVGEPIEITAKWPDNNNVRLFQGAVTLSEFRRANKDSAPLFYLRVSHVLQRLLGGPRYAVYEGNEQDALKKIFTDAGVPGVTIGDVGDSATGRENTQLVRWNCSDWQWLRARLHAQGAWMIPKLNGAICRRPTLGDVSGDHTHTVRSHLKGTEKDARAKAICGDFSQYAWSFNNETIPPKSNGVSVDFWNEADQRVEERVFGEATPIATGAFDARKIASKWDGTSHDEITWQLRHSANLFERKSAQTEANARLMAQQGGAASCSFSAELSEKTCKYELGDKLVVEEFNASLSGEALITGIRHFYSQRDCKTTVSTGYDSMLAFNEALVPRASGLTVGVVRQSKPRAADSRLLVYVPLLGASLWARHAVPYASRGAGLHLLPQEKDEVILSFLDDDPRYPVIVGATHSSNRPAPTREGWTYREGQGVSIDEQGAVVIEGSTINLKKS